LDTTYHEIFESKDIGVVIILLSQKFYAYFVFDLAQGLKHRAILLEATSRQNLWEKGVRGEQ
jgi:hypothetical protein